MHYRCLKQLLDYNTAIITKTDTDGNNALHIACIFGQLHIVQFLLQHGLSAEMKYVTTHNENYYFFVMYYSNGYLGTPLSCAAYHGHDHIVKFLLSRGASCNGSYDDLKVLFILLYKYGHMQ